jgi:hypothetical protein
MWAVTENDERVPDLNANTPNKTPTRTMKKIAIAMKNRILAMGLEACGYPSETEETSNERDYEEDDAPLDHGGTFTERTCLTCG